MPTKHLILAALLIITSLVATGCSSPHLYSHRGRVAIIESAKTVGEDQHSVGVYAGNTTLGEFNTSHLTAGVRQGLRDNLELGVDASFGKFSDWTLTKNVRKPTIWSARLSTKWAPEVFHNNFAVIGGVGGGTHVGSQFISPDIGFVLAYDNPHVVPYMSVSFYASVPLNAQRVVLGHRDRIEYIAAPTFTWGATTAAGLRVPIDIGGWSVVPSSGIAMLQAVDEQQYERGLVLNLGRDVIF